MTSGVRTDEYSRSDGDNMGYADIKAEVDLRESVPALVRKFPAPIKCAGETIPMKPLRSDVMDALRLLYEARVRLFQMLRAVGLMRTMPQTETSRWRFDDAGNVCLGRYVVPIDGPEQMFASVMAIEEALATGKTVDNTACCPAAQLAACTCRRRFDCPIHGTTCVGSHE